MDPDVSSVLVEVERAPSQRFPLELPSPVKKFDFQKYITPSRPKFKTYLPNLIRLTMKEPRFLPESGMNGSELAAGAKAARRC